MVEVALGPGSKNLVGVLYVPVHKVGLVSLGTWQNYKKTTERKKKQTCIWRRGRSSHRVVRKVACETRVPGDWESICTPLIENGLDGKQRNRGAL